MKRSIYAAAVALLCAPLLTQAQDNPYIADAPDNSAPGAVQGSPPTQGTEGVGAPGALQPDLAADPDQDDTSAQAPGSPVAPMARFETLDRDGSGSLSRSEAEDSPRADALVSGWRQFDLDGNDELDRAEFSAFNAEEYQQQQQ